jgi:hypothetical protein
VKDFVSDYWVRVVALAAALGVIWAVFGPVDVPFIGLMWVVVALSVGALAAGFFLSRSSRPIREVLDAVEAELGPVVGEPVRVPMPAQRGLGRRGEKTP